MVRFVSTFSDSPPNELDIASARKEREDSSWARPSMHQPAYSKTVSSLSSLPRLHADAYGRKFQDITSRIYGKWDITSQSRRKTLRFLKAQQ
jgi:hypothetical protein